jgi:hypothetical protein
MGIADYSCAILLAREGMTSHMFETGAISLPRVDENEPMPCCPYRTAVAALAIDGAFSSTAVCLGRLSITF